ncbi:GGDEF domain-containing protein [Sphingomonas sp. M1-B02]|uniref:GGDEF domain-containing protein n=1 Tax=Sphingomonas sp. M1-B02 TaxID=3114300 RepID=UPI00223F5292|nr:GGDEF domain-containing protein [Sphingomonas sp. S6-11]UZK66143.1 GGDEF domain-containing protein [Sphingomonas sp. S6-11]
MNAIVALHAPLDRLTSWLRRGDDGPRPESDGQALRRLRFEQIGAFLSEHDLEPSTSNFDFALRLLREEDSPLAREAGKMLQKRDRLSDRDVERIVAHCAPPEANSDPLGALARELEGKVAECLAAVGDSSASTSAYSTALDAAADQLATEPAAAYRRLLALTLEVAETTRRIGGRLERTRRDTRRLRADLDRAVRAAEEDHLTGLPNRRGFLARMEKAVAANVDAPLVLALCDIDNFKAINDGHGHETGDRVLRFVAQLLREKLSRRVLVARYGGEEFVCLFQGIETDKAAAMLDDARVHLGARSLRDQVTNAPIPTVTFSAGIAAIGTDPAAALRAADEMLYVAKHRGKDLILTAPD